MTQDRVPHAKHPTLGMSLRTSSTQKWHHVLAFFWYLYISTAEVLPTKFAMPSEDVRQKNDDDFDERYVQGFLRNLDAQFGVISDDQIGPGSFAGPRRYLEHAQPIDLFYQYMVAEEADGRTPATLSTFMRVFHKVFKHHIKFRDKKEHAECNICGNFKKKIKEAKTKAARADKVSQYSTHLLSQWLDRQIYWKLRELSRSFFRTSLPATIPESVYSSCLTQIVDGMDQSKLRCPKFGYDRLTKSLERLFRPSLHLVCAYIHGYKAFLPITDENVKKDAETQCEIIIRSLGHLADNVARFPLGYHLQQDNCPREGKNQFLLNLMLLLQVLGIFRWTRCGYLRTGHSHEDVDMIFGQLSKLLRGKKFDTPSGLINLLESTIHKRRDADAAKPDSEKPSRLQGAQASPYKLDQCACWKRFVKQVGVVFKGARLLP